MKKVEQFINSIYFIILVNLIAVIFWYLKQPLITYGIYVIFLIIILFTKANRAAVASLIMSSIIAYQESNSDYLEFHKIFAMIFIPLGAIVIVLFVIDIIKRKKGLKFTPIFYGFLSVLIVNILAFINVRGEDLRFIAILGVLQLFGYLVIYFYILNTQDNAGKKYISNVALITATAITIQFLIHYQGLDVISKSDNELSWAVSNTIAMFYLVLIPIGLYNYFKNQKNFLALFITGINSCMMLFMLSRGAYFALALILIPSVVLFIYIAKEKSRFFIDVITTAIVCFIVFFSLGYKLGLFDMVIEYFKNVSFFNDNGRYELYKIGFDLFKKYPIFGAGSYSGAYYLRDRHLGTYHNYIIQVIATTGILGLISLLYFIYTVIKTSIKKHIFNTLFLISFLYILVHGLVDNSFYNPVIMIFLVLTMPFLEQYHENLESLELK